ncbi:MAG TPA: 3-deoxy-D-manno-octulosonic acid kinase [Gammaproteobacteria bacterium]|nr:3-deoxy-D-manno-octulosonic acid kinase [Gammaproteobacteria bacterium]
MIGARLLDAGNGIVLYDEQAAAVARHAVERWFDREYWGPAGTPLREKTGRAGVIVLDHGDEKWVLRHYNRGGFIARFVRDHYVWTGIERTRAFREWRLLARLRRLQLPVPRPIAARVLRRGLLYRADIVTGLLPGARPLSAALDDGGPARERWADIGRMLRAFHDHGVQHPDLTAHNILLGPEGGVFLVDFDNASIRAPGKWREAGLARLQRSLRKIALETGAAFDPETWSLLDKAYRAGAEEAHRASAGL